MTLCFVFRMTARDISVLRAGYSPFADLNDILPVERLVALASSAKGAGGDVVSDGNDEVGPRARARRRIVGSMLKAECEKRPTICEVLRKKYFCSDGYTDTLQQSHIVVLALFSAPTTCVQPSFPDSPSHRLPHPSRLPPRCAHVAAYSPWLSLRVLSLRAPAHRRGSYCGLEVSTPRQDYAMNRSLLAELQTLLNALEHRDVIVKPCACWPDDVTPLVIAHKPRCVLFSGHGGVGKENSLAFQTPEGELQGENRKTIP